MHSLKYLPFPINASGETERHIKVRTGNHICMSTLTRKNVNNKKNLPLKINAFCKVTCVSLMIFPS